MGKKVAGIFPGYRNIRLGGILNSRYREKDNTGNFKQSLEAIS